MAALGEARATLPLTPDPKRSPLSMFTPAAPTIFFLGSGVGPKAGSLSVGRAEMAGKGVEEDKGASSGDVLLGEAAAAAVVVVEEELEEEELEEEELEDDGAGVCAAWEGGEEGVKGVVGGRSTERGFVPLPPPPPPKGEKVGLSGVALPTPCLPSPALLLLLPAWEWCCC